MPRLIIQRALRLLAPNCDRIPPFAIMPMTSFMITARRLAWPAAIAITIAVGARSAAAQNPNADSLAALLGSADVHERAVAVARLNALPESELTAGARSALVALLDAEATRSLDDQIAAESEDETYDEYLIDLTDVVLKLHDPASIRGLTLVGIQTGHDVQAWIASRGAASLPALDEAWASNPDARPTILTTWAMMLVADPGTLGAADRSRLLAAIVEATDALPIAVAGAARTGSLTVLAPALSDVAAHATSDVVRSRAEKAVGILIPLRDAARPLALLDETDRTMRAFCARPGLDNVSRDHPNRPAACGEMGADMNRAEAALRTGRPDAARAALASAAATANEAATAGALTSVEAAVVAGNVAYLLTRI